MCRALRESVSPLHYKSRATCLTFCKQVRLLHFHSICAKKQEFSRPSLKLTNSFRQMPYDVFCQSFITSDAKKHKG